MAHGGAHPEKLDVSASINPLGLHPAAKAAFSALACDDTPLSRYPDSDCMALRALMAQFWLGDDVDAAERVVCGAGAVDLIYALVQAFARPALQEAQERCVVVLEPAFTEYARAAAAVGVSVRHVVLDAEHGFALTETGFRQLEAALDGASMLFAASPANPSGVVLGAEQLMRLSALCYRTSTLFVLDSCFSQFSASAEAAVRALLSRRLETTHLVVLHACTKFYGMAGIRLGYALCGSSQVAARLRAVMRPWAVGAVELAAGSAVLRAELAERPSPPSAPEVWSRWERRTRALVATERAQLSAALCAHGFAVVAGEANYVLFRAPSPETESRLCARLLSCGVAIRSCADFCGLDGHWYRVAVRTAEENARLCAALAHVCAR